MQHVGKTNNVSQWRPQIMGYGVAECLQLLIESGQPRSAIADTLLQLSVDAADLDVCVFNLGLACLEFVGHGIESAAHFG